MKKAAFIAVMIGAFALSWPPGSNAQFNEQVLCQRRKVGVDKYKKLAVADGYDSVETYMRAPRKTQIVLDLSMKSTSGHLEN